MFAISYAISAILCIMAMIMDICVESYGLAIICGIVAIANLVMFFFNISNDERR